MPDRSASWRALGAALVTCLLGAASAPAAETVAIPADAPVVAGPTASGVSAVAFVRHDELCMAFLQAGAPRPTRLALETNGGCTELPVLGPFGWEAVAMRLDGAGHYGELGVTGGAAAWIAFKRGGQTVVRAGTKPSPLPGVAATLRFYAIEADAQATSDEVALLDTFDAVQRAFPPGDDMDGGGGLQGPPTARGTTFLRGRRGAARWTLRARIDHPLAPTPLLPERRAAVPCLTFATVQGSRSTESGELCADEPVADEPLQVDAGVLTCSPVGTHVTVLARPAVRRVVAVLGDGRSRTIALHVAPGAPAGTRAGVTVLGEGIAVRRVIALGVGGRRLSSTELGLPPGSRGGDCGFTGGVALISYHRTLPRTPLGAGPHVAHVVTDGVRLCLAIDRTPRPPAGCNVPPVDALDVTVDAQPTADGRFVAAIVPREVAAVRLLLDDGSTRTVTPTAITGPYAGLERLVALDVPGPHRVVGSEALRDDGLVLGTDFGPEQRRMTHTTVLVRRPARGLAPLTAAQIPARSGVGPVTCVGLGPPERSCALIEPGFFAVRATCAPRRIVVFGLLHRATQHLAIRTAAGTVVTARNVPLPGVLRRAGKGFTSSAVVALAVLPADAAPRALLVRGPAASRTTLALPPAREQCGYRTFVAPALLGTFSRASPPRAG